MQGLKPLLIAAALCGCDVALTGTGVQALDVRSGAVSVQGPEGFCADAGASRPRAGFAVLASCATISDIAVVPSIDGLITVQVGEADTASVAGSERDLVALLRTDAGRAVLSQDSNFEQIEIMTIESSNGVVSVVFVDNGPLPATGLSRMEWRAFTDVRGRLTTISVRGIDRAPLTQAQGLRLLNRAVFSLSAANSVSEASTVDG